MRLARLAAASALIALPSLAQAHVGFHADGLAAGALHPLTGLDHLLAMLAVGLWAATLGGAARWVVPAAFVAVMATGAAASMAGLAIPGVEPLVAASVCVLGIAVLAKVRVPVPAAAAVVAIFALAHGSAHGSEMPAMASPVAYALGFAAVTASLHAAGLAAGLARPALARVAGLGIALSGFAMLVGG